MMIQAKYKSYPVYKKSGAEWAGEIPEGWKSRRWRFVAKCNPVKSESLIDDNLEVQFVPMELVPAEGTNLELTETRKAYEVQKGYTYFINNDVLIAKITPCFENGKGAIAQGLKNDIGFGTTELHVYRTYSNIVVSRYLFLISKLQAFRSLGAASMKGAAGQKRVTDLFIKDFIIPLPPLPEQQAIADFLDRETARINGIVEKQTRMIELLKEKRSALITKTVTKGLDPHVKLKPSGVEWVGDIPERWEVRKLKTVSFIEYGLSQPPEKQIDGVPLIRATNVKRGKISEIDLIYINPKDIKERKIPYLHKNDIVVVRSGAYTADSSIISEEYEKSIAGYDMIVRANNVNPLFLSYTLLANYILYAQLIQKSSRAAQPHLNKEELGSTIILLPPPPEQQAIADFLDCETARIDKLIEKIEKQIELLNEYRQSLITSAVTGKIDLRGTL